MRGNQKGQEKGQARIQQLKEMFPDMTRLQVVMTDYMIEGLRQTPALDEAGRWAWLDSHDHYDYDYEEHKPEDLIDGVARIPKHIYIGKGKGFFLMLDSHSPYEVKYEGRGCYWLYRDDEPIDEVHFVANPKWFWDKTSTGRPMNVVTAVPPDEQRFNVYVTNYCEYFKDDCQCRFCNINPTVERFARLRGEKGPVKHEQDVYEAYLAYAEQPGVETVSLIGGSFVNRKKEAELYLRNIEVLKRAMRDSGTGYKPLILTNQAMEAEDQLKFKEAGVVSVSWHQEVWDPKLFQLICPGKAKYVGRDHWIDLLVQAVENFGRGKVGNSFVVGAEMAAPYGNKTEDEEFESITEGIRFMASHGITSFLASLRGNPGSLLAHAQRPRIEYYLRMEQACSEIQQEHNLAPKKR